MLMKILNFVASCPRLQSVLRWLILNLCAPIMRLTSCGNFQRKSVLFVGQAYYNSWYLSRSLRQLGWTADLLNWDKNPGSEIYYHGEDFTINSKSSMDFKVYFFFYFNALLKYDVFHFANKGGLQFGELMRAGIERFLGEEGFEIRFLKALGKKIVYSNNGCSDGVSQTAFSRWGPPSACSVCRWQNEPAICSDERNLAWGKFRNELADYQCTLGGNRADYNDDSRVHEVPEFYCLDKNFWKPDIEVIPQYHLPKLPENAVRLYHAVGHRAERTKNNGVNIKSSHVYIPLVDRLRHEGYQIDLIEPSGIPNKEVRFLQVQADIFLDMLSFGWYGANAREGMMLGKPVICYLRPEWLESVRAAIPEFVDELPIISATPESVEEVLRNLIGNRDLRRDIGRRSREFAIKWHSSEAGARRFNAIYSELLGRPI